MHNHSYMKYLKTILIFCSAAFSLNVFSQEARLMRFPTIYNDQVVFSYAGDLYTVNKSGGTARKLTSDVGYEMFSKFSPDGKTIAFTGQYDGNTEIYSIPAEGGAPKRLTYTATLNRDDLSDRMGPNNIVMAWQDNEHIIYRSRKESFNAFIGSLYIADVNGGLSRSYHCQVEVFVPFHQTKRSLPITRYSVNSEHGNIIGVAWQMIYGSMILQQSKR